MDADAQRMLADLGLDRRELLSAVDEEGPHQTRATRQEGAAIRAEVETRRARHASGDDNGEDDMSARLRAWNTETSFDDDPVAAQLENRWSGQGHRAELKRQLNSGPYQEAVNANASKEGRSYAPQRGNHYVNYVPSRLGNNHPYDTHAGLNPSTPRIFTSGNLSQGRGRGGPPPQRPPGQPRALSPRRHGTIRIDPRRVAQANAAMARISQISKSQNAAAGAAAPKAIKADIAVAEPMASPISDSVQPVPGVTKPSANRSLQADAHNPVHFHQAIWCAAYNGEEKDRLLKKYPNCVPYVEAAREQLINETINLAKDGTWEEEVAEYIQTHPERKWMVEAAAKARSLVENNDDFGVDAYYATHQQEVAFLRAARNTFKREDNKAAATPAESTRPWEVGGATGSAEKRGSSITGSTSPAKSTKTASVASNDGAKTTIAANAPTPWSSQTKGALFATFIDAAGAFVDFKKFPICAPVQASISIQSCAGGFNSRDLIDCVEALAKSMAERSECTTDLRKDIEGAHLESDGLWVETF